MANTEWRVRIWPSEPGASSSVGHARSTHHPVSFCRPVHSSHVVAARLARIFDFADIQDMFFALCIGVATSLLAPLDIPPVINSPTYSLATLNSDGSTNMNILTYATPAGVTPRLWAVSIYKPTRTHANFVARKRGVLQLLCDSHADLVFALGGQSGTDIDKAAFCAEAGMEWMEPPTDAWGAAARERLLPGCVAYLQLVQVGELIPAGEHDLALCRVEGVLSNPHGPTALDALSTQALREAGLISDRGRAIAPDIS